MVVGACTCCPQGVLAQGILAKERRIVDIISEILAMLDKGSDGGRNQHG
jgi:hypothetical protein